MISKNIELLSWLRAALDNPTEYFSANHDPEQRNRIYLAARNLAYEAYVQQSKSAFEKLHHCLALIYRHEFESTTFEKVDIETRPTLSEIQSIFENAMLQHEVRQTGSTENLDYPHQGKDYVRWLKKLISQSPSSVHEFYTDFLGEHASVDDLKFYLIQETNLDPRFDDILAFMQVGLPVGQKLELAKNYFDEMGNGEASGVHSKMFAETLESIGVTQDDLNQKMLINSIVSGNLSACLALSRRHFFKAVGYFGVTEYLAPRRFKHVVKAWHRNKLPDVGSQYHTLHIHIDTEHANGWFNNVVVPLIDNDPRIGSEIAKGALLRINSSARYLDELLHKLSADSSLTV